MSVERHFLGWSTPALPAAAEFLLAKFSKGNVCDLSSVIVTLPSSRASRRFLELLAWSAERPHGERPTVSLTPPRIVTLKQLPQSLLKEELLSKIASETETLLAWVKALQQIEKSELKRVYATLPGEDQVLGWWTLAQELHFLDQELAGAQVCYSAIEKHCRERGLKAAARWSVLHKIALTLQQQLHKAGLLSEVEAQQQALENAEMRRSNSAQIVLLATTILPSLHRELLKRGGFQTLSLIHAPVEKAAGFGDYGELKTEFWAEKPIDLKDEWIQVSDRAVEQIGSVAALLKELPHDFPDDAITVGLGDEDLAPALSRAIEFSGRKTHSIGAAHLAQSSPLQLLKRLVDFVTEQRPESFLELLRHPALGDWLERCCDYSVSQRCLLTICDHYFAQRLPSKITSSSFRLPLELKPVLSAIDSLLPEGHSSQKRAFGEWMTVISRVLEEVYSEEIYSLDNPEHFENHQVFEALGTLFKEFSAFDAETDFSPRVNFTQAIRLLLNFANAKPLSQPAGEGTVELVRWIEVHLDDAPVLALVGLNESYIPDNVVSAPFLTDSLRREFGILDNRQRYARDAYLLRAICSSRRKILLACSRQSLQGDPLQPSRLLFACDADTAVRRAQLFYREQKEEKKASVFSLDYGKKNRLATIPRPAPLAAAPSELGVTRFRDYLACPYRFYLTHICNLRAQELLPSEMEAHIFGSLFHEVLRDYGREVIEEFDGQSPHQSEQISERLCAILENTAKQNFGTQRLASVDIQLHQLERRLKEFAHKQKKEFEAGWQIWQVEQQLEENVEVDGQNFLIHGKVDRIDFHPEDGIYRILDYKTGAKKPPEKSHRTSLAKGQNWIDLQLPLYRRLSSYLDLDSNDVQVGFFCLPSSLKETGLEMATWEERDFQEAYEVADDVIRAVRAQEFWPPSPELPLFKNGLEEICQDKHIERNSIIAEREAAEVYWPFLSKNKAGV